MKKLILILSLLVAGCGFTHEPRLAKAPENQVLYQKDLKECRNRAFNRMSEISSHDKDCQRMSSGFGLLGAALACGGKDQHPEAHKNMMILTDECVAEKGYEVIGLEAP